MECMVHSFHNEDDEDEMLVMNYVIAVVNGYIPSVEMVEVVLVVVMEVVVMVGNMDLV